jgi:uncharacterized repeat protein (TIGR03803 family)
MRACGIFLLWAAAAVSLPAQTTAGVPPAQTFNTLYNFCSQLNCTDGWDPVAGLIQGTDGNLYGTTVLGGANSNYCENGSTCGTVFKITPSGTLTTLYSFCPQGYPCTDGAQPEAGLVQGTDGNFYGTTLHGGDHETCDYDLSCGAVFMITPSGMLTTLYSFDGTNGIWPIAGLIQATDGNFYGTASSVFQITPSGTLTVLAYPGGPDSALIQGTDGIFYGTGAENGTYGYGTVFSITAGPVATQTLRTLFNFNGRDGQRPYSALIQSTDGDFYGTTYYGGTPCYFSCGTVFKITPSGTLTTLYSFDGKDGEWPYAGLVQATDGNFYGATAYGGANGGGTVFKITPSGALTTLYNFCSQANCTDGEYPDAALLQDTNGTLYGTTAAGGAYNGGTVFSLSVGLGPFVETQPTSGAVGAAVKILGTSLTGATSVTFNGTAATFTVVSSSEITTTVPTGATTGTVQVVTPRRTLSSNVPFRVK